MNDVSFSADEVRFDAHSRTLDASGHVAVDESPFHLTSPALTLRRIPQGVRLEGQGRVAFCPCLGTPLAIRFAEATVAPPHDLVLEDPVLEVFGLPVAWLPAVWLRSTGRAGLLPPDVEWRGRDGFFAGGGFHVPWSNGDTHEGLSVRAGGYAEGGVALDTSLTAGTTVTRVHWDRLRSEDGVGVDARGSATPGSDGSETVRWRVSALRGARAVQATSDVGAAAQPLDRAGAEMAWLGEGWTAATGVRTMAARGGRFLDAGAGGPTIALRRADAIGAFGAYDATVEGGQVAGAGVGATSFVRAEAGSLLAARAGLLGASLSLRGAGDLAADPGGARAEGGAESRLAFDLPLARSYASGEPLDPWVHTTDPRLEAAVLASHAGRPLVPAGRAMAWPDGAAWVTALGWDNRVDRASSRARVDVDVTAGLAGTDDSYSALVRARAGIEGPWVALTADFARALAPRSTSGGALISRARVGPAAGLNLAVHVAERDRVDPQLARVLVDPVLEPESAFLAAPGWTGGAAAALPVGSRLTLRGAVEADLDARTLVATSGAIEAHDPCNCVVLRLSGAHRIGREGVDVWLSVDLPLANR
jgi:hypothetical protein